MIKLSIFLVLYIAAELEAKQDPYFRNIEMEMYRLDDISVRAREMTSVGKSELVLAFVVFRHGESTPDKLEKDMFPSLDVDWKKLLYPYGEAALTDKGKERSYNVGKFLRRRYNRLLSKTYLPEELEVRSTDFARTKMSALAALASLYCNQKANKWHKELNWQPVPYSYEKSEDDELTYWRSCPRYRLLKKEQYEEPNIKKLLEPYKDFFEQIKEKINKNFSTPTDVSHFHNLLKGLDNVDYKMRNQWVLHNRGKISEVTEIEFQARINKKESLKVATGPLLHSIVSAMKEVVNNDSAAALPKLRIYSAHESNIGTLMGALNVFKPVHEPNYGASFALELRKCEGKYYVAAVYLKNTEETEDILPMDGCTGLLCDFESFIKLVEDVIISKEDWKTLCNTDLKPTLRFHHGQLMTHDVHKEWHKIHNDTSDKLDDYNNRFNIAV